VVVVPVAKLDQGSPEFLQMAEVTNPEQLLFEGAKETFDASIGQSCQLQRMATMTT
jgi:hypothetical protein